MKAKGNRKLRGELIWLKIQSKERNPVIGLKLKNLKQARSIKALKKGGRKD